MVLNLKLMSLPVMVFLAAHFSHVKLFSIQCLLHFGMFKLLHVPSRGVNFVMVQGSGAARQFVGGLTRLERLAFPMTSFLFLHIDVEAMIGVHVPGGGRDGDNTVTEKQDNTETA